MHKMRSVPGDYIITRDEAGATGYADLAADEMRVRTTSMNIRLSDILPEAPLQTALQYANPACHLHAKIESIERGGTPNALRLLGGAARNILKQWSTDPRRTPTLTADLSSIFVLATKRGRTTTYTSSNLYIHKLFSSLPEGQYIKYMNGKFVSTPRKFYLGHGRFANPDQSAFNVTAVLPCESCICVTASGRHFVYDWQTCRGQYTTLDPYYRHGNIIDDFGNLYPGDPIYSYDPEPQQVHVTAHTAAYDVFRAAYEAQTDPAAAAEHAARASAYAAAAARAASYRY